MHPSIVSHTCISKLKLFSFLPTCTQVRWRKIPPRKPRCLPMSPYKIFRIPKHPDVPLDEKQLVEDLLDEYYRKFISLRKLFQDEIKEKADNKEDMLVAKQKDEELFKQLLEENKQENERIKIIREETLEREFQEKQLEFLQKAEDRRQELEKVKLKIEKIVKAEKERSKSYITLENIDQAIENAIDNPVNLNFSITLDGTIKWEGKPPLEYEADINRRIEKGKQALSAMK